MIVFNAIIFFFIALIYSSAGFGGGSSYLAMLSQFPYSNSFIRFTGLSCNALVTSVGSIQFYRKGWIVHKPLFGLLLFSVPFCLWSASWAMNDKAYFITLAFCLVVAGIAMLFQKLSAPIESKSIHNPWWLYLVCAAIGLLSGYTGIGGGVYLAPILHFIKWGSAKHIAASCSVFILVNSIAGLIVQAFNHTIVWSYDQLWLLLAVLLGGAIGSRMGSSILSQNSVRLMTAVVIIFAGIRILFLHL